MPAYFQLSLSIKKSNLYDDLFRDLTDVLIGAGLEYKCGYWEFEDDRLEDIIVWNSKLLRENFELGYDEHYSHDYKQSYWRFRDFSEVRLYILNESEDDHFEICIIIPEDDLLQWEDGIPFFYPDALDGIKELARRIWVWGVAEVIQTDLELSARVPLYEIAEGAVPSAEPFAIIPADMYVGAEDDLLNAIPIENNGIMLEARYGEVVFAL